MLAICVRFCSCLYKVCFGRGRLELVVLCVSTFSSLPSHAFRRPMRGISGYSSENSLKLFCLKLCNTYVMVMCDHVTWSTQYCGFSIKLGRLWLSFTRGSGLWPEVIVNTSSTGTHRTSLWLALLANVQQRRALECSFVILNNISTHFHAYVPEI